MFIYHDLMELIKGFHVNKPIINNEQQNRS